MEEGNYDGKVAFDNLVRTYAPGNRQRRSKLQATLFALHWKTTDTVGTFKGRFLELRRELIATGKRGTVHDSILCNLLLSKIANIDMFQNFVTETFRRTEAETESDAEFTKASREELERLFEEMSTIEAVNSESPKALGTEQMALAAARPVFTDPSKGKHKIECNFCGHKGHIQRDCPHLLKASEEFKRKAEAPPKGKVSSKKQIAASINPKLIPEFILDSGASDSVVFDASMLTDVRPARKGVTLTSANGGLLRPTAQGTLKLKVKSVDSTYKHIDISDVLATGQSSHNLISTSSLARLGHTFSHGPDGAFIRMNDGTTVKLNESFGVPTLGAGTGAADSLAMHVMTNDPSLLELHFKLGHLNMRDTKMIAANAGITFAKADDPACPACMLGKSTRTSVPTRADDRSSRSKILVHVDILPFECEAIGGYKYAAVFVLDSSRFGRVYGMKQKSDMPHARQLLVRDMKTLGPDPIILDKGGAVLQCDSGSEFVKSEKFADLCGQFCMRVQAAPPATQAKNGVVERFVGTLVSTARTILIGANLGPEFWFLALRHSTFLRNISPATHLKHSTLGCTPYRHVIGKDFDLTRLHIFGAPCFVHVERDNRKRLEATARPGIYVGYSERTSSNLVYMLDTRLICTSYHVRIDDKGLMGRLPKALNTDGDPVARAVFGPYAKVDRTEAQPQAAPMAAPAPLPSTGGAAQQAPVSPPPAAAFPQAVASPRVAVASPDEVPPPAPLSPLEDLPPPAVALSAHLLEGENARKAQAAEQLKDDPATLAAAMQRTDWPEWRDALTAELKTLIENGTFTLVKRRKIPINTRVIGNKVVFKTKRDENNVEVKKKARIVARGFMEAGTDEQLTFAPTSKYSSLRLLLSIAAADNLELAQCDIKAAYLQAKLPENDPPRYMEVPEGLQNVDEDGDELVCLLHKSLHGLSAAGRLWSEELKKHLESQGFCRTHADGGIYARGKRGDANFMAVFSWVDDLTLMGSKRHIKAFMRALKKANLETSSSGELRYIVNLQIQRDRANRTITISQESYIKSLLERFGMADAHPTLTPMVPNYKLGEMNDDATDNDPPAKYARYAELIGSLLYVSNTVRPDISFHVSQLARFMTKPRRQHWKAALHVLRYLKGTMDYGITFDGNVKHTNILYGFADSDWAGDQHGAKSTSGYVFVMNGGAVTWSSKRQSVTALSTAEAELISASAATQEATYLRQLLLELSVKQPQTLIFEDNEACIKIAENPITSQRTKHVKVKYFYVREAVQRGEVQLVKVKSEDNAADALTKSLPREGVAKHRKAVLTRGA